MIIFPVFVVYSLSCVQLFTTLWTAACQAPLSSTISWNLLKFMSIELVVPSNHLILCCPLLLLPLIFPSIRVFSNESVLHIRWPKYWCFSKRHSNEYSGLISFRIDWFDLFSRETVSKGIWLMKLPDSPDFPGGTGSKEPACQCRRRKRCRFNPCVRKNPWRKAWQPTAVFLPENPVEKPGRR